jgi:hypothetical protein
MPACRKRAELDKRTARKIAAFAVVDVDGPVGTREQLLELAWVAARRGSVSAMRLLLEELRRDGDDDVFASPSIFDELEARRRNSLR